VAGAPARLEVPGFARDIACKVRVDKGIARRDNARVESRK